MSAQQAPPVQPTVSNQTLWDCPKCGSPQTQRLSVLRAASTSTFAGLGAIGTARSNLAAQLDPPKKSPIPRGLIGAFLGWFVGMFIGFVIDLDAPGFAFLTSFSGAVAGFVLVRIINTPGYEKEDEAWEASLRKWDETLLCLRCGERFEVS